ncbi:MAG TPA: rhodanese-like domain-containing protein, partial [Candidatus Binatia bacterium]|nr:rhodanese-like domain-containing protein [Candidatus Binatia bacterium]
MKSGRKTNSCILLILVLLGVFCPMAARAGHGVEDTVDNLSADRAKQLLDAGEKLVFVDLRPAKEFQQSRLPGARSIPIAEIANRFNEIPKNGRVVLYCDCKTYDVA